MRPRLALDLAIEALKRGRLVRAGRAWSFHGRLFSNETVAALIKLGIAERIGDTVGLLA